MVFMICAFMMGLPYYSGLPFAEREEEEQPDELSPPQK